MLSCERDTETLNVKITAAIDHYSLLPTGFSPEDQAAITSVSGPKFGRMAARHWMDADASALEEFKAAGIKIVDADPAFEKALTDNAAPLTAAWIQKANDKGIDGQAAYDFYVKRINELSK